MKMSPVELAAELRSGHQNLMVVRKAPMLKLPAQHGALMRNQDNLLDVIKVCQAKKHEF